MDQALLDKLAQQQADRLATRTIDPKLDIVAPPAPKSKVDPMLSEDELHPDNLDKLSQLLYKLLDEGAQTIEIGAVGARQAAACLAAIAQISRQAAKARQQRAKR